MTTKLVLFKKLDVTIPIKRALIQVRARSVFGIEILPFAPEDLPHKINLGLAIDRILRDPEKDLSILEEMMFRSIRSGNFDVVIQPAGSISIETSVMEIGLRAGLLSADKLEEIVWDNPYAERICAKARVVEHFFESEKKREVEETVYDAKVVPSPDQMQEAITGMGYEIDEIARNRGIINHKGAQISFELKPYGLDPTQMIIYFDVPHPDGTKRSGYSQRGTNFSEIFKRGIDEIETRL